MDTPLVNDHTRARSEGHRPLPALTKWLLATLVAIVFMLIYLQVAVAGSLFPPIALLLGLPAIVVGLLIYALRWRGAPLLGVLYWMLIIAINSPHMTHDLAHPEVLNVFAFTVIVLALSVLGIVAGVVATVQNYSTPTADEMKDEERHVPRWFPAMLWSLAGLCLGAILFAGFAPARAGAGVSAETLATLPALGATQTRFEQTELRAKVGEVVALRLENRETMPHTFNIDELNVHISMPPGEPTIALFKIRVPGTYTFYCDVPGHREAGMVGTLIVAP